MTMSIRRARPLAAVALAGLALAGCDTFGSQTVAVNTVGQPQQLQPLANSNVNSSALPPLQTNGQPAPGLSGTPQLGGVQAQAPSSGLGPTGVAPTTTASIGAPATTPGSLGNAGGAPGTRDLSAGLAVDKLTGTWTVASGPAQCRLSLTNTLKGGTTRYGASTPGCTISGLSAVASWTLAGSQVQLFDQSGKMIAALVLSGNRFIGTSAGGAAISMTS